MAAKSDKSNVEEPIISWQHVWTLDETNDAFTDSGFARIPNELILRIFQLLSVPYWCSVAPVCRRFKMLVDKNEVWKLKCKVCSKLYFKPFKQIYMNWTYMKCVRNIQLRKPLNLRRGPCEILLPPSYPVRPTNKHQSEAIGEFRQHPNSTFYMTIRLSVGIEKTASELIKLRNKASQLQSQWQQSVISKQMITRYYRFMQLKASHPPSTLFIPTLDIEIVWLTHLLRPNAYQSDCLHLFHQIIDHSLLFTDMQEFLKEQAFRDTCVLYEQRFGESYCLLPPLIDVETVVARLPSYLLHRNVNYRTFSYWDETKFEFLFTRSEDYENPFTFTEA